MKKLLLSFVLIAMSIMAIAQFQTAPEWTSISSNQPETFQKKLISSTENSVKVNVQVPGFYTTTVTTPNGQAKVVTMPKAVSTAQAGEPDVPMTGIPVMIGDKARMNVRVIDAQYMDFENIEIAPSKGDFPRTIDPETVPYTYGECYNQDAFFPAQNLGMYDPYIIRDFRGQNMAVYPFAYNPVTKTLRVYYNMTVEMYKVDDKGENIIETRRSNTVKMDPDFKSVYQRHFINYEEGTSKYTPLDENGDLLIICYDNFINNMTDFVNWKKTRGINTTIVGTSTAGTTASAIKSYIQSQYNANNNITHVLLVGDVAQIPGNQFSAVYNTSNDYSGYGDNLYGQIVGNDIYNDVIIGRFSASTAARVTTQANRAITYERDLTTSASWLQNGVGISRKENGSGHNDEDDYQHMNNIRTDLLNYGYTTVTQRYANLTGYDASASTISSDINSGAGIVNYANHGQETAWGANSSGYVYYANSHVNALTNENKLPFIFSVACLVGKYDHSSDCFAEAWMNATNNNNPTGAVGTLMSYISQPWIPPMWAQDECIDILVGNSSTSTSQKQTYGGVCINGLMGIFDNYATTDKPSIGTYQAWIVYGDPSLMVRTKTPQAMTVNHNGTIAPTGGTYSVSVSNGNGAVATITDANHNILGKATVSNGTASVNVSGSTLNAGDQLTLCVFGYNKVTYLGTISVIGGTEYTISTNVTPTGAGTVTGGGTYYNDTQCTLTAAANHGYAFDKWNDNNTQNPRTITVTGNATYTANFKVLTEHHFTYNPQQTNGSISVSPETAYAGDIVTLTATPAAGYCLDQWDVNTVGKGNVPVVNNQFTMPDSDVTISATFKSGYTITVATVANGTITASTTSAMTGDAITLIATPNTGCEFSTWYVYKTGDPNTLVAVVNNSFTMPSYDVTVSAVFATTSSGDVTIGSGTATNNGQYLPSYTYYNYSLTQQIYTVAEVGEAGTITAIAFQVSNSKAATRTLDIYMVPTTKDAFTSTTGWEVLSSAFKVYSGSVSFSASGWTTITLDTPYEYDGVKNLCVGVVDNTGSYLSSGNYPYFYTYSTSANRALRVYNDDNAYNVGTSGQITQYTGTQVQYNNQIKLTKVTKNNETLTVSPEAINDFSYLMGMGPTEAQAVSIVGADLSNDITVTAPTDFEVSTSATGTYSSSVTIPRATGSKGGRSVTSWGFEGSLDNWTAIDIDGDGYGWVLGSATSNVYLEDGSNVTDQVSGHNSSTDMMVSGSWTDATTTELHPDNWLVSPQVELGGSFSLWARPFYTTYPLEHFGIYVSTTSNSDPNAFTLLGEWTLGADDWKQFSADLHAYQGQNGYIAVRHFNGDNQFLILLDDFELDTDAAYNPEFPVTITSASVYVRMKANLNIGDYSGNMTVASGTLSKTVALSGIVEPNGGEQYDITVVASPTEGGTVTGAGTYYEQSRVTLTATPATHYTFEGWQLNGTTVSTSASYQITVTGDATYTAVFAPMTAHNVAITQPTGGAITSDLATAYAGDVVTVTYTVVSGYFFVEWSVVDGNSQPVEFTTSDQSAQFTMPDSDVTVTATFTTGYNVTLNQTANGTISADVTTNLQPGDIVTLTATPDAGCVFLAWYAYETGNPRDVVDVISNTNILMPASDVTVQAIFVTEEEQEAQLGSGTNTNDYIPTYVRARYSLSQQIYLASELDNQKGRITKIAYRGTTASSTRNLDIYIRHTDNATFSSTTDWTTMGPSFKVFSGSVTFSTSDWTTITLDTPFEYDGSSNIIICVVDNTGSTSGSNTSYTKFYNYSATNRALYANGNSAYSNVNYSSITNYTGTRLSYVNRINITMMVPGSAESLTVSPGEMADFSYVENHGPSHTDKLDIVGMDLQNDITVTAPTNFEISLTENGTYASSVTVPRETGSKGNRNITTWNFDDGLGSWTTVDADGDGNNWYSNTNSGQTHNSSAGSVTSASYSGGALTPDNWLISPQVELGGSFSMWACPQDAAWPQEHFGIFVSTTDANPSSFTKLNEWTCDAGVWKQYSVDLRLYAGQTGYIAVRHFDCTDLFRLNVDDFELDTEGAITIEMPVVVTPATVYVRMKENLSAGNYSGTLTAVEGTFNGSVSLSGEVIAEYDITVAANPSVGGNVRGAGAYAAGTEITVRAAANTNYTFVNWTENGTSVSTNAEYTFTVTADRDLVANFQYAPTLAIEAYTPNASPSDGWYLIASPLNTSVNPETDIDGLISATPTDYDLYYFDQTGGTNGKEWKNYKEGEDAHFSITPGKGYLYANANNTTITFIGTPYAGDGTVNLTYTADHHCSGWNLIGNPYTIGKVINRSFYRMNSTRTEIVAAENPTDEIAPMEGVFVYYNPEDASNNANSVTFATPSKAGNDDEWLSLNLNNSEGSSIDRVVVRFSEGGILPKLTIRDNTSIIYVPKTDNDYAVVSGMETSVVPVNFSTEDFGVYTLRANVATSGISYMHLFDKLTGEDVDMLLEGEYTFMSSPSDRKDRFVLNFHYNGTFVNDIFAYQSGSDIVVTGEGQLQIFDVMGRYVGTHEIHGVENIPAMTTGVYIFRMIGEDVKTQKIVVR